MRIKAWRGGRVQDREALFVIAMLLSEVQKQRRQLDELRERLARLEARAPQQ